MKALDRPNWLWLVAALAVVGSGVMMVLQSQKPPPPAPPLPNPNGYDDFLKAAQAAVKVSIEVQDGDLATLAAAVEQNREALRLIRLGLSRERRVPVEFTKQYGKVWMASLSQLHSLARVLVTEGTLAERQGRYNDAAASYLDCIRFGGSLTQGGLGTDKLVAGACELYGMGKIRRIGTQLTPQRRREVIDTLQVINGAREPIMDIIERDDQFQANARAWWEILRTRLEYHHTIFQSAVHRYWQVVFNRYETTFRLGIIDLAIQHHRVTTGHLPARLRDLVPTSISKLPEDPFNPAGFIYRTNATGYLLYSIGPDGKDDGGAKLVVPPNHGIPTGDILPQ